MICRSRNLYIKACRLRLVLVVLLAWGTFASAVAQEKKPKSKQQTELVPLRTPKLDKLRSVQPAKSDAPKPVGQEPRQNPPQRLDTLDNKRFVRIENADTWQYDKDLNADAQVLVGNVAFSHDGAFLYCDSAYFYEATNSFDAYSNVLIQQGDTLFVYGDVLYYDGNTKLARLRGNVLMDNLTATLRTDSLNYDRAANVGYYFDGGILEDAENTLFSEMGHYYPSQNLAVFRNDVELTNEKFVMNSDTLRYTTDSHVASILGPTTIVYEEQTTIYSEYGWYNTDNEQSKLLKNSYVQHTDGKRLEADTIFYDKKLGRGEGFTNVRIIDTIKKVSLNGHYGYYYEKGERGVVTDSAEMIEYSTQDTLYLHADTLRTFAEKFVRDSLDTITAFNDTVYKVFIGYNNVRFFRSNIQGVCDSSYMNTKDSVLYMFQKPAVWSDNRQLTGDTIRVFQRSEKLQRIVVNDKAFATDSVENNYFNQLSGKQMIGYIQNDTLKRVDVLGNAESIYFMQDKDSTLIGMASTLSAMMNIYFNEKRQLDRIVIKPQPKADITPMDKIDHSQIYLPNYIWWQGLRPTSREDIFRRTDDVATAAAEVTSTEKSNGKKTTRRTNVKPVSEIDGSKSKGQQGSRSSNTRTNTTTTNRPSGFGNPNIGGGSGLRPLGGGSIQGGGGTLRPKR